jgi:hypothetical protein
MPPRRKEKVFCKNCNKELKLKRCGKYNKVFCSLRCMGIFNKGKNNPSWKGGRFVDRVGYVRISTGNSAYSLEHRLIMEIKLKRKLERNEVVHHIDGNKGNNALPNLALTGNAEHSSLHTKGKPLYKNRKFLIVKIIPEPKNEGNIISVLPSYRTYITSRCLSCNKLFWHRKDFNSKTCSPKCRGNGKWNYCR